MRAFVRRRLAESINQSNPIDDAIRARPPYRRGALIDPLPTARRLGLPMQHPTTPHASRHSTAVKATKEEMDKNQVDLALRDACAHLLIPLNK